MPRGYQYNYMQNKLGLIVVLSLIVLAKGNEIERAVKYQQFLETMVANPTDGWTEITWDWLLNHPWDLPVNARYEYKDGAYHFWVYDTDQPHQRGSDTHPRCEMSMKNHYTSGNHQLQADFYIPSGTTGVTVTQILGGDDDHATSLQLRVFNGSLKVYSSTVVASNIYDKWFRLNLIHRVSTGKIEIYINGKLITTTQDKGYAEHYFKVGVYMYGEQSHKMESYFKNIKQFVK